MCCANVSGKLTSYWKVLHPLNKTERLLFTPGADVLSAVNSMKPSLFLILPGLLAVGLSSCTNQANPAADTGYDASNPYGVPQAPTAEVGSYTPAPSNPRPAPQANAPYQPIGNVPSLPPPPSAPSAYGGYSDPSYNPPPASSFGGRTVGHTVVPGDTLWGLSKRYNTSVEEIQAANGLTGSTIKKGETLQIPQ